MTEIVPEVGVAIVGGTGYGAGELLRLCLQHPQIEVVSVVSASAVGESVSSAHPHLEGIIDQRFQERVSFEALARFKKRVLILALPHGTAASYLSSILKDIERENIVLIDLSGDLRLVDAEMRQRHYPEVSQELQERAVYGMSELFRDRIKNAQILSTPGCLAAVVTLAALPLFSRLDVLDASAPIVADAKTGTSGAGRSLQQAFHHPTRHDNANAYKALAHRHEPEIAQNWQIDSQQILFVPHLIPCSRGCLATVYLQMTGEYTAEEVFSWYQDFYQTHPAIRLRRSFPELIHVLGTNYCDISLVTRGRQIVCFAALDNLGKGTAGQAIQNINIRFGYDELLGLRAPALGPA